MNHRSKLRNASAEPRSSQRIRKLTDLRIRRTRGRLGSALVNLIVEKPIEEITVQEVLDRAGVGRSTFYLHFSDKEDLFLSQMEDALEMWSTALSRRAEKSNRVAPVMEFFAHVGSAGRLYRALVESGRIQSFFDLAQGYFARGIARRINELELGTTKLSRRELDARSHAFAGNLVSLLKWWLDHGTKESPKEMDELFNRLVWNGLR